jgi:hypothetical protein
LESVNGLTKSAVTIVHSTDLVIVLLSPFGIGRWFN